MVSYRSPTYAIGDPSGLPFFPHLHWNKPSGTSQHTQPQAISLVFAANSTIAQFWLV